MRTESSRGRRGNEARRLNGLITVLKMPAEHPRRSRKKSEESTRVSTVGLTETKIVFPLDELLPLPKHHSAETVTAKEKELSPAKQVESVGKSTGSTAANESSKPSVDASNGLATDGSSKLSGQQESVTRSENETKPDGNESTPLGPSKPVGGESTFLDPTKPLGNEPTLLDPSMSESTISIQPTQLKLSDQQASDPKTHSISSVPTASSTTTIDLTISPIPSPILSTQPQPDSDDHVPAVPVISSI